jgi:hypothetical protein
MIITYCVQLPNTVVLKFKDKTTTIPFQRNKKLLLDSKVDFGYCEHNMESNSVDIRVKTRPSEIGISLK